MKVSADLAQRNSEDVFKSRLRVMSDAGAGVIHVRTHEPIRAANVLRKQLLVDGNIYKEWDIVHGMREFTLENMNSNVPPDPATQDIHTALALPEQTIHENVVTNDEQMLFFVYVNPHFWMEQNPIFNHYLQHYASVLPRFDIRVVLITPDLPLPDTLSDTTVTLRFETPGHSELRSAFEDVLQATGGLFDHLTDDDKDRVCNTGSGMTRNNFETWASLTLVDSLDQEMESEEVDADYIVKGISKGKTEIVNKSDILELYPVEDIKDVGGMDNLKEWIAKRANCYSDEAAEHGIEPPKGLVLVGIPGTGKSLSAKAIAREFGVPLIRMDFGAVFNSLVGSSEQRMRTALNMVESMAPCVLFADEIDKGLAGTGGSGDSGTSSRVLGYFLTWLNDTEAPVFTMVTANNIDGLPPELLRKGRFDETFATGFPTPDERMDVLNIHLRKRGYEPSDFSMKDRQLVVKASKGYVPAEIEAAVKEALIDSFDEDNALTMDYVVNALKGMVPLSVSRNTEIQQMVLWAKQNAKSASKAYEDLETKDGSDKPRRISRRVRKPSERTH